MQKHSVQSFVVTLTVVMFALSSLGYLLAPARMLAVVGMSSMPDTDFLVRALAVALLALVPSAWVVRHREAVVSRSSQATLIGLSLYMVLSAAVDLHAYFLGVVGESAVPSVVVRGVLGAVIAWLVPVGADERVR